MKKNLSLTSIEPFIRFEMREGVAVFRLTDDVIDMALDLKQMAKFWDIFDASEKSSEVSAMLFIGTKHCFSPERCDLLFEGLLKHCYSDSLKVAEKWQVSMEENAMFGFVRKIRTCPKAVSIALQGDVAAPFLGTSLGYDQRIVSEDTIFHIQWHELGMPPIGGLAYFLPLYLGWGRANRILLEETRIKAEQALDWGFVDHVVPLDDLEESAINRAREFGQKPRESISGVKRLMDMHLLHMEHSLDNEREIIDQALNRLKLKESE